METYGDFSDSEGDDMSVMSVVEHFLLSSPENFLCLDQCVSLVNEMGKKKRIRRNFVTNYWTQTVWGNLLTAIASEIDGSYHHRLFRRRFRLPFNLFQQFVEDVRGAGIFPHKRISKIPIEFKVLCCLRILGRDSCADAISELCGIGESTANAIFHTFVEGCSGKLFSKYVYPPEGAYLRSVKDTYAKMGFPGAIGSMDCTHIRWDKCPSNLQNVCRGKEKYPSLAFQVVVDHARRILAINQGWKVAAKPVWQIHHIDA